LRSCGLSTRKRSSFSRDKPSVLIITDRNSGRRYVIPVKAADESMIRLLLADHQQESLFVYTDEFQAHEPLEKDELFDVKYGVHDDGEYTDDEEHVDSCESHAR